jgi:hypothetical protein
VDKGNKINRRFAYAEMRRRHAVSCVLFNIFHLGSTIVFLPAGWPNWKDCNVDTMCGLSIRRQQGGNPKLEYFFLLFFVNLFPIYYRRCATYSVRILTFSKLLTSATVKKGEIVDPCFIVVFRSDFTE